MVFVDQEINLKCATKRCPITVLRSIYAPTPTPMPSLCPI